MGKKSSDFDRSPTIEKPSFEEAIHERLRKKKEKIKTIEQEIYKKIKEHIEKKVKLSGDITYKEKEKIKQCLFKTLVDQLVKPLKEEVKAHENAIEEAITAEARASRKLKEAEEEVKDISEFELQRSSEEILEDIREKREKGKET